MFERKVVVKEYAPLFFDGGVAIFRLANASDNRLC
jgi:hypothetical protein